MRFYVVGWAATLLAKKFSLQCPDKISFQQPAHVNLHIRTCWITRTSVYISLLVISLGLHIRCSSSSSQTVLEFNQLNLNAAKTHTHTHAIDSEQRTLKRLLFSPCIWPLFNTASALLCNVLMVRFWLWLLLLLWFEQSLPLTKPQIILLCISFYWICILYGSYKQLVSTHTERFSNKYHVHDGLSTRLF